MARMGKNHYEIIAKNINTVSAGADGDARSRLERLAYLLADFFQKDNVRFRRDQFLKEAGF